MILAEYSELPAFLGVEMNGPNTRGNTGEYPIHVAAIQGNIEYLCILVEGGALIDQQGEHGYTALQEAVEQGHIQIVKYLLSCGADKFIQNDIGLNSMDIGQQGKHTELIRVLEYPEF